MHVPELLQELRSRGVPENAHSIGQARNESYCLTGAHGAWHVYYSERGLQTNKQTHPSEHAACHDLLSRLLREVMRSQEW